MDKWKELGLIALLVSIFVVIVVLGTAKLIGGLEVVKDTSVTVAIIALAIGACLIVILLIRRAHDKRAWRLRNLAPSEVHWGVKHYFIFPAIVTAAVVISSFWIKSQPETTVFAQTFVPLFTGMLAVSVLALVYSSVDIYRQCARPKR